MQKSAKYQQACGEASLAAWRGEICKVCHDFHLHIVLITQKLELKYLINLVWPDSCKLTQDYSSLQGGSGGWYPLYWLSENAESIENL